MKRYGKAIAVVFGTLLSAGCGSEDTKGYRPLAEDDQVLIWVHAFRGQPLRGRSEITSPSNEA
jgi:hypothetical protein